MPKPRWFGGSTGGPPFSNILSTEQLVRAEEGKGIRSLFGREKVSGTFWRKGEEGIEPRSVAAGC
jgi:hypothetical protein